MRPVAPPTTGPGPGPRLVGLDFAEGGPARCRVPLIFAFRHRRRFGGFYCSALSPQRPLLLSRSKVETAPRHLLRTDAHVAAAVRGLTFSRPALFLFSFVRRIGLLTAAGSPGCGKADSRVNGLPRSQRIVRKVFRISPQMFSLVICVRGMCVSRIPVVESRKFGDV